MTLGVYITAFCVCSPVCIWFCNICFIESRVCVTGFLFVFCAMPFQTSGYLNILFSQPSFIVLALDEVKLFSGRGKSRNKHVEQRGLTQLSRPCLLLGGQTHMRYVLFFLYIFLSLIIVVN